MSQATLKAATLAILDEGNAWTQGANARKANGLPCSAFSPAATSWDVMGALIKAQLESDEPNWASYQLVYKELRNALPEDYRNDDIESFNDEAASWDDVAALFA